MAVTGDFRMSIVMLCESFHALGGVAQIVQELAVQFARAGHRVAIVSNPQRGKSFARKQAPAVEQVWIELPRIKPFSLRHPERLWQRRTAPELLAFLRRWQPDLINIHGGLRDRFPAVLAASTRAQVPIIQSFHLVPEPSREQADAARLNCFSSMALRLASAITFPSNAVKDRFQQISLEAERARIIRGGVNLEDAAGATPLVRSRPYIFSASRLDLRHKAIDVLIEAFSLLAADFPGVDLMIAGDGPERTEIEQIIARSELEARVYLLSSLPHEELWSLYKGALIFVMLSRMAEGLPLVFFEAMACGTPVVGTRSGGTPELVTHEDTGLLVELNEPTIVAAAIRTLLANPGVREKMGRRGSAVAQTYNWQAVACNYLELYQGVVAAAGHWRPGK
jgi:glycosyltransferase involved in cell wall biosynthesis